MTPSRGWPRRWESRPRLGVEGGVKVARPGKVTDADAVRLVERAVDRTSPAVASRGRTYARAGQVVELRVADGQVSAAIQGTANEPYAVSLSRAADGTASAVCTCPYGCDEIDWCKHAAALAYVLADLLQREAGIAGAWSAAGGESAGPLVDRAELADLVATLRAPLPQVDGAAQWAAASEVCPPPG